MLVKNCSTKTNSGLGGREEREREEKEKKRSPNTAQHVISPVTHRSKQQQQKTAPTAFAVVLDPYVQQRVARLLLHLAHIGVVLAVAPAHGLTAHVVAIAIALRGTLAPRLAPVKARLASGTEVTDLPQARVLLAWRKFVTGQ